MNSECPPIIKEMNNSLYMNIDNYWYEAYDSNKNIISAIVERSRSYNKFTELDNSQVYKNKYILVDVATKLVMVGDTEALLLPHCTTTSFLGLSK